MPKTAKWFKENGMILRNFNELDSDKFILKNVADLIDDGKVVQASDVIRNYIL